MDLDASEQSKISSIDDFHFCSFPPFDNFHFHCLPTDYLPFDCIPFGLPLLCYCLPFQKYPMKQQYTKQRFRIDNNLTIDTAAMEY